MHDQRHIVCYVHDPWKLSIGAIETLCKLHTLRFQMEYNKQSVCCILFKIIYKHYALGSFLVFHKSAYGKSKLCNYM